MRRSTLITALLMAVATTACGPRGGGEIPVLDVTKSYPTKDLILQDIADVEYIPLETREGFLLDDRYNVQFMDDEYIVTCNSAGDIMFFDRHTGKGIRSFNRQGRGPVEYVGIYSIAVDKTGGEMFVTPNSISSYPYPMYVYDLEGKPLRTVGLKRGIQFPSFLHNYDEGHLFFYNIGFMTSNLSSEPYGLMSKTDSVVTYLPVKFEGRGSMSVTQEFEGGGISSTWRGNPIARTRDGLMLSEPGIDTMFRWNSSEQKLIPVMTQKPAFNSMEYPIGVFYLAENDEYMFVQSIERKYDWDKREGFKTVNLTYDKRSGEFFEGVPMNADFADDKPFSPQILPGIPAEQSVMSLQPYQLIELHVEGKLRGPLAELAPKLKEDDNPVMMIVTFK